MTLPFRTGVLQIPFAFGTLIIIQLFVSQPPFRTLTLIAVMRRICSWRLVTTRRACCSQPES